MHSLARTIGAGVIATEARIVLAQVKISEKSNEITAIPKLLQWLDIEGCIVTIDAMGCQFVIDDMIKDKEGVYIFSPKGNQGNLADDVTMYMKDSRANAVHHIHRCR